MTTLELIERGVGANCLSDAYDMGRADQKKADNEFFNFESAYEMEKQKIRADAIDECIQWIVSKFSYIDELDVPRIRCNASTIEINMREQLMQKGEENE